MVLLALSSRWFRQHDRPDVATDTNQARTE